MIVSLTATSLKSKASLAESTSRRTLGHTLCKARFHAHFNEAVLLLAISHLIPGSWRGDLAHQRKKKKNTKTIRGIDGVVDFMLCRWFKHWSCPSTNRAENCLPHRAESGLRRSSFVKGWSCPNSWSVCLWDHWAVILDSAKRSWAEVSAFLLLQSYYIQGVKRKRWKARHGVQQS